MDLIKKISWLFLGLLVVTPLTFVSAKGTGGNKWLLNKSVVQSVDTTTNTITATKNNVTYTINVANAKIVRKYNATAALSEVLVGDSIQVFGTISGTNVTAKKVRDLSIQRANGKFNGTIKSIDTTTKTFVLQTAKRGDQTVTVSDSTVIKYKNATKTFTDLAVGNRVIIRGIWNSTHKTVYNLTRIKITRLQ